MNVLDKILLSELFEGHQLYYVGGYVRDQIMGIESNDIDFATDLIPDEVIKSAKDRGIKFWFTNNSLNHGTITILDKYEVTTFRKDFDQDGRHTSVEFAKTIEEDLSRRDFTINAIAVDFFTNNIVDPFNGIQDIHNKIIRAVGNPEDRLKEDTLRALRAIRFANKFKFEIEHNLLNSIRNINISNLSVERIREEFIKILSNKNDNYISNILYKVIPEFEILKNLDGGIKHTETVDIHSLLAMKHVMSVSDNSLLVFATLLHDIGKFYTKDDLERSFKNHEDVGAERVKEIMIRMKFANNDVSLVCILVKNHMRWHFLDGIPTDRAIRRAIRDLPDKFDKEEMVKDLCLIAWADSQANLLNKHESLENYTERKGIYKRALRIVQQEPEIKVGSGLELNGNDLIEMGFKPSSLFNTILTDVLNKVIEEDENIKLENNREILKKYIMRNYEK